MRQNKGQMITVSLRWRNKESLSQGKSQWLQRWEACLQVENTALFYGIMNKGLATKKELNNDIESWVCVQEITGLNGAKTERKQLGSKTWMWRLFLNYVTSWALLSHTCCYSCSLCSGRELPLGNTRYINCAKSVWENLPSVILV